MQQMKNRFGGETAKYIRIVLLVIYDILAIFLAEILSIWTRFDFSLKSVLILIFICICHLILSE